MSDTADPWWIISGLPVSEGVNAYLLREDASCCIASGPAPIGWHLYVRCRLDVQEGALCGWAAALEPPPAGTINRIYTVPDHISQSLTNKQCFRAFLTRNMFSFESEGITWKIVANNSGFWDCADLACAL